MRRRFRFKETFYSFLGGTIASFACTIIYGAIDQISNMEVSVLAYIFEWSSGIIMCISCACLLWLASTLGSIEAKFNEMKNLKKDIDELWFRSIRAIAENKIVDNNSTFMSDNLDDLVKKKADKIYCKLIMFLIIGCFSFVFGLVLLIMSKVV